ncbi:MAG: sigma-70 family RNA polymerase sigma factor [Lentisphaerae bacterium]|nr:sigma-70 family RNA polymerase sigma factor [Lentisphaerota bacterium]
MADDDNQRHFLSHFLRHQDDIRAVIASMVRDRTACDDVFQEVALVLWRKFDEFDATRSFGAWARGIAVRKVLQSFDKTRRTPVPFAPETIDAILAAFDAEEPDGSPRDAALVTCIGKLPEKSRSLVALRYDEGLSLDAIARRIASTLDAVNKALSRIRSALRDCIEREVAEAGG